MANLEHFPTPRDVIERVADLRFDNHTRLISLGFLIASSRALRPQNWVACSAAPPLDDLHPRRHDGDQQRQAGRAGSDAA